MEILAVDWKLIEFIFNAPALKSIIVDAKCAFNHEQTLRIDFLFQVMLIEVEGMGGNTSRI